MNRVLIRREIFRRKQAYRTEIAKTLGLTLPTITTTVQELIREGLAEEVFPEKTDAGSAGRPASTMP